MVSFWIGIEEKNRTQEKADWVEKADFLSHFPAKDTGKIRKEHQGTTRKQIPSSQVLGFDIIMTPCCLVPDRTC